MDRASRGNFLSFKRHRGFAGVVDVDKLHNSTLMIRPQRDLDQVAKWLNKGADAILVNGVGDVHQGNCALGVLTNRHFQIVRACAVSLD